MRYEYWEFDGIKFYPATGAVECEGRTTQLSGITRKLLAHFLATHPNPSSWATLVREVWQEEAKSPATVRGAIKQLRDALAPRQEVVQNGPSGYFLAAEPKYFTSDGIELVPFPGDRKSTRLNSSH